MGKGAWLFQTEAHLEPTKMKDQFGMPITEMCDVCGKDCVSPIPRSSYISEKGIIFTIRHHVWCDPKIALKRIGILKDDV